MAAEIPTYVPGPAAWLEEALTRSRLPTTRFARAVDRSRTQVGRYVSREASIPLPLVDPIVDILSTPADRTLLWNLCSSDLQARRLRAVLKKKLEGLVPDTDELTRELFELLRTVVDIYPARDEGERAATWSRLFLKSQEAVGFTQEVSDREIDKLVSRDNVLKRIRYPFCDLVAFLASRLPDFWLPEALKLLKRILSRRAGRSGLDLLAHNLALYLDFGLAPERERSYFRQTLERAYGRDSAWSPEFAALLRRFQRFGEILAGGETSAVSRFLDQVEQNPQVAEVTIRFEAFYLGDAPWPSLSRQGLEEPFGFDLSRVVLHAWTRLTNQARNPLRVEQWCNDEVELFKLAYIEGHYGWTPFQQTPVPPDWSSLAMPRGLPDPWAEAPRPVTADAMIGRSRSGG